ncbi:hypothetical protein Trydic_g22231 [Trypoxylus dichotomus]
MDNKFYQQEFGMTIGSLLSPVLSNIYMEEFERRAMDSYELQPKMWLSYVDDTFVIWPHGEEEINGFLQHLNGLEESIKFTMELEVDNKIPFLDISVHKQSDGTLRTTVYKKPIHTGQYLDFEFNHPHNVKLGVAQCLYNRAREVCSDDRDRDEEFRSVTNTLKLNGCTKETLSKAKTMRTTRIHSTERQLNVRTTPVPYMKGLSEKNRTNRQRL